jgi:hypothetical protein
MMRTLTMKNGKTIDDLVRYRNKINGIIYYAAPQQKPVLREGVEYLAVVEHPHRPRIVYVARSALERLINGSKG